MIGLIIAFIAGVVVQRVTNLTDRLAQWIIHKKV